MSADQRPPQPIELAVSPGDSLPPQDLNLADLRLAVDSTQPADVRNNPAQHAGQILFKMLAVLEGGRAKYRNAELMPGLYARGPAAAQVIFDAEKSTFQGRLGWQQMQEWMAMESRVDVLLRFAEVMSGQIAALTLPADHPFYANPDNLRLKLLRDSLDPQVHGHTLVYLAAGLGEGPLAAKLDEIGDTVSKKSETLHKLWGLLIAQISLIDPKLLGEWVAGGHQGVGLYERTQVKQYLTELALRMPVLANLVGEILAKDENPEKSLFEALRSTERALERFRSAGVAEDGDPIQLAAEETNLMALMFDPKVLAEMLMAAGGSSRALVEAYATEHAKQEAKGRGNYEQARAKKKATGKQEEGQSTTEKGNITLDAFYEEYQTDGVQTGDFVDILQMPPQLARAVGEVLERDLIRTETKGKKKRNIRVSMAKAALTQTRDVLQRQALPRYLRVNRQVEVKAAIPLPLVVRPETWGIESTEGDWAVYESFLGDYLKDLVDDVRQQVLLVRGAEKSSSLAKAAAVRLTRLALQLKPDDNKYREAFTEARTYFGQLVTELYFYREELPEVVWEAVDYSVRLAGLTWLEADLNDMLTYAKNLGIKEPQVHESGQWMGFTLSLTRINPRGVIRQSEELIHNNYRTKGIKTAMEATLYLLENFNLMDGATRARRSLLGLVTLLAILNESAMQTGMGGVDARNLAAVSRQFEGQLLSGKAKMMLPNFDLAKLSDPEKEELRRAAEILRTQGSSVLTLLEQARELVNIIGREGGEGKNDLLRMASVIKKVIEEELAAKMRFDARMPLEMDEAIRTAETNIAHFSDAAAGLRQSAVGVIDSLYDTDFTRSAKRMVAQLEDGDAVKVMGIINRQTEGLQVEVRELAEKLGINAYATRQERRKAGLVDATEVLGRIMGSVNISGLRGVLEPGMVGALSQFASSRASEQGNSPSLAQNFNTLLEMAGMVGTGFALGRGAQAVEGAGSTNVEGLGLKNSVLGELGEEARMESKRDNAVLVDISEVKQTLAGILEVRADAVEAMCTEIAEVNENLARSLKQHLLRRESERQRQVEQLYVQINRAADFLMRSYGDLLALREAQAGQWSDFILTVRSEYATLALGLSRQLKELLSLDVRIEVPSLEVICANADFLKRAPSANTA